MRSITTPLLTLLAIMLVDLAAPVYGSPRSLTAMKRKDGGSSSNGIPTVDGLKNPQCKSWYGIRDDIMRNVYKGRCNDLTRAAVRLAFHDAGPYSNALKAAGKTNGAADGSLLVSPVEQSRPENNGLQAIIAALKGLPQKYNVSSGDVLHLAGTLAVLACPGGPVINTYIGRKPPAANYTAPDGLLPNPNSPVQVLLNRFADMGFSTREFMALMGAHSTAKQRFVDTTRANQPMDSTVEIWDVRYYSEMQNLTAAPGTYRLNSDVNFAHNATTQQDFNRFVGKQDDWGREYAAAHEKMSLLGLDKNTLTDCTEIMPQSIDLSTVTTSSSSGKQPTDSTVDPAKLEAAIQKYRSIWIQ
ncbi:heme peroxidase [Mycena capillaripes]|nr:heme peroxidase [Mycena capillaripes]